MSKSLSGVGIEKRIRRALEFLGRGDPEDAIFNISPAIDATAKKRYTDKKVGDRIKKFIFDEQPLIYYLSMRGVYLIPDGVRLVLVDMDDSNKPIGGHGGELADFIYHNVRCAQTHEAEIDYEFVDFGRQFGICRERFAGDGGDLEDGKFIISCATVLSLILSVVCAPENIRIKLRDDIVIYNNLKLCKSELVGNKQYLMAKLKELFANSSRRSE